MPTESYFYCKLKKCSQETVNAIYERLMARGGLDLKFPERLEVARALRQVEDGRQILAEERVQELEMKAGAEQ